MGGAPIGVRAEAGAGWSCGCGIASPALAVMSAQHILCAAPTYHAADVVDLELIVENANHPQVATFMFRYYEGPGDFNVSPVVVPIRGGSSITITGMCL